jgi:hypothetical protein
MAEGAAALGVLGLLWAGFIWIMCMGWAAAAASSKHRSGFAWFVAALLFGPLALLALAAFGPFGQPCTHCGQPIAPTARWCPWCGPEDEEEDEEDPAPPQIVTAHDKSELQEPLRDLGGTPG